jgi:Ca2+-binding EF-hand superfamily protein
MISGISSLSSSLYTSSNSSSSTSLTDDQKTELNSILANYDSSDMTQSSTQSLLDTLKSSGIQPSQAVQSYIASKGFNIQPPQGPPPPDSTSALSSLNSTTLSSLSGAGSTSSSSLGSISSSSSSDASLPAFLQDFIDKEKAGSVTQDDINSLVTSLQNSGQSTTGALVDQSS